MCGSISRFRAKAVRRRLQLSRDDGPCFVNGAESVRSKLTRLLSTCQFHRLRFTPPRAKLHIARPATFVVDVSDGWRNSAIIAMARTRRPQRKLDFNAKIFPFHESDLGFKNSSAGARTLSNVFRGSSPVARPARLALPHRPHQFLHNSASAAAPRRYRPACNPLRLSPRNLDDSRKKTRAPWRAEIC